MVSWGQEREEMVNHSLKDPFGEWVICHIGNNSGKKGKHPSWGDLQVSQSICGEKVWERKVCNIRARGRSGGGGVPEDDKGGRRGEKRDNKGN